MKQVLINELDKPLIDVPKLNSFIENVPIGTVLLPVELYIVGQSHFMKFEFGITRDKKTSSHEVRDFMDIFVKSRCCQGEMEVMKGGVNFPELVVASIYIIS